VVTSEGDLGDVRLALDSYLVDFEIEGAVDEFILGSAKFKFSGTGWSDD
jgi:hypothetical protein